MSPERLPWLEAGSRGFYSLLEVTFFQVFSFIGLLLLFFWSKRKQLFSYNFWSTPRLTKDLRLILQFMFVCWIMMLALVLLGNVSVFHMRWVIPVLILFPLPVWAYLFELEPSRRKLFRLFADLALVLTFLHGMRWHIEEWIGQTGSRTHCSFEHIPIGLDEEEGASSVYLAQDFFLAGNMLLAQPHARVHCAKGYQVVPVPDNFLYLSPLNRLDDRYAPKGLSQAVYRDDCVELRKGKAPIPPIQ